MLRPSICFFSLIIALIFWGNFSVAFSQEAEIVGTFYVSSSGSDLNDGLTPDKPFATPEKARDAIRKLRTDGVNGRFVVYLSGCFHRSTPFVLEARDSNVSYLGTDNACFFGGVLLEAWRIATDDEKAKFGDRRAVRARFPNVGFLRPASVWEEFPMNSGAEKPSTFQELRAKAGDLDALNLASTSPEELRFSQFIVHHHWDTTRRIILGYDSDSHALKAKGAPMKFWNPWRDSSLYYLENLRAAFDAAGEWFYDGVNKQAYYRPIPGEALNNTTIIAPRPGLNQLVTINGEPNGEKVSNIR